eukprot:COSAG01_NODE_740_length_13891_cov_35.573013_2_plen_130_part_00
MDLSNYLSAYPDLILSESIKIPYGELTQIFEKYSEQISEIIGYMIEDESYQGSLVLNNGHELEVMIDSPYLHLYYKVSNINKKNKYNKLLDNIYQDFNEEDVEGKKLKDRMIANGIAPELLSEIDDLDK